MDSRDTKLERFQEVRLDDEHEPYFKQVVIILSDYTFWAKHRKELDAWSEEYNCHHTGMLLTFPDAETFVLFKMEWSG